VSRSPIDPAPDLAFRSAIELAQLVRDRDVSSRELVELYLARIERLDADLDSYVEVLSERARSAADAADERTPAAEELGPLHGCRCRSRTCTSSPGRA
jgi:amidase